MKILQIHNKYNLYGGEDFVVNEEKKNLENNGHKVYQFFKDNKEITTTLNLLNFLIKKIFKLHFFEYKKIKSIILDNKIEVVHFHNIFPQITDDYFIFIKSLNIPIVMTLHNYRINCINGSFFRKNKICEICIKKPKILSIQKKCFQNSYIKSMFNFFLISRRKFRFNFHNYIDRFIVFSEFHKNIYITMGIPENKIYIKSNFINDQIYNVRQNRNSNFLFIGRTDIAKGIDSILDFWIKNHEFSIDIVGQDTSNLQKKYLLYKNIKFYGHQASIKVKSFLNTSKILIFPSLWHEGFPITIIQAAESGIPILASNKGILPEIIIHQKTGLIYDPDIKGDFEVKAKWMIDNYSKCLTYAKENRKLFEVKFNKKVNLENLLSIYDFK